MAASQLVRLDVACCRLLLLWPSLGNPRSLLLPAAPAAALPVGSLGPLQKLPDMAED